MTQQKAPITVALLVWDYFDELINKLDIYTEKSIEYFNKQEKRFSSYRNRICKCVEMTNEGDKKDYDKIYEIKYTYEKAETLRNEILASLPAHPTQIEYFEGIRAESIRRIKQLRDEVIAKVKQSTTFAKCNPSHLTPEELEDLRSRVFANSRFCFLIDCSPDYEDSREYSRENAFNRSITRNKKISGHFFELITVFTDFYLSKNKVDNIE
jgi:hypothetical protein